MIKDTVEAVRKLLGLRAYSYKSLFRKEDQWAQVVLRDLAQFCRAHKTTYHNDPRVQATLEGRREVWLRIQEYINLSESELFELHQVKYVQRGVNEKS